MNTCCRDGCDNVVIARDLCRRHYDETRRDRRRKPKPPLPPLVVLCPEDLEDLVAQAVENDARPIFRHLWRVIGEWHLAGLLDEEQEAS